MLHLRIVSPAGSTDGVLQLLRSNTAAINIVVIREAVLEPPGDLVLADVAREAVNSVMSGLHTLGVQRDGSIALLHVDTSVGEAVDEAERQAPGYGTDAAVWEQVEARVRDESVLTASFLTFLVVAALIAAVGLIEDSPILIVGAMVVGPEFGPIAGLSMGLFMRSGHRILKALGTLSAGLATGAVAALVGTAAADAANRVPADLTPHMQPLTGFVVDPSVLSVIVAFLAGIAGTLSLTQEKAGALIGVLISVTIVPAVAAVGVSGALGDWGDAAGAALLLALNITALVLAGVLTLWVQREAWDKLTRRAGGGA